MTPLLSINDLDVRIDGRDIVHQVSLSLADNEVVAIMGPNGCGKSTILRAVYRALEPAGGTIMLGGEDLLSMPFRRSAQHVAALAQDSTSDLDFTVEETVAMCRVPHSGGRLSEREKQLCEQALHDLGIMHLRARGMLGLSGGERQRVLIARARARAASFDS